MGTYNPHFPVVIGNELAPVAKELTYLDTATMFGYTFTSGTAEDVVTARVITSDPPPGQTDRKCVMVEVYPDTGAPGTGAIRKAVCYSTDGSLDMTAGASLGPGVTHPTQAYVSPANGLYMQLMGPSTWCNARFNTWDEKLQSQLANGRILDVSVRYAATGPFDLYPNGLELRLERTQWLAMNRLMDNALYGPELQTQNVVMRKSRLGELNPFWQKTVNPNNDMRRGPWVPDWGANGYLGLRDFSATVDAALAIRMQTASDLPANVAFRIHYLALEVTYCQEGRIAAGGLEIPSGPGNTYGLFQYDVPLFSTTSWGFPWDSQEGFQYLMAVGQGHCGTLSVTNPVPLPVTRLSPGAVPFAGHRGVVIRRTLREDEEWAREEIPEVPAIVPFTSTTVFDTTTIYRPAQVYNEQIVADVAQLTFTGDMAARMTDAVAGRSYTHIRFYARCLPGTLDSLRVALYRGAVAQNITASIGRDEFDELPEMANGWRQVTLPLSSAYVSTGTGTVSATFTSTADLGNPWQVLGADSQPNTRATATYGAATYGAETTYPTIDGGNDQSADLSVMLIEAMPVPSGLAVVPAVQALDVIDEYCGVPVEAIPTGIRYHQVSWTAVNTIAVAGFGYYEVQRRDTTMPADEWETIAQITNAGVAAMDDYEARVGVVSSYRVRMVHVDGYESDWSSTATSTITAPGVTGEGVDNSVLILTSNHNPSGNLAYVQTWDGEGPPEQDFTYPEGSTVDFQEFYNRDYRVAFRPLERGGVEFTRTLLLNAAGIPSETLDRGVTALRDLAWSTVPHVCVRDERSNRWLTAIALPGSSHTDVPRQGHLVLAAATFTEVADTPAPVDYEAPCEGLTLENRAYVQDTRALPPAALVTGTRVLTDTFSRTVAADGWGSADTGQAWTKSNGGATEILSVSGGVGSIQSGAAGVETRVRADLGIMNYRVRIKITVPAVATGAPYSAGLTVRRQNNTNFYRVGIELRTDGNWGVVVSKQIGGVDTTLKAYAAVGTYAAGNAFWVEALVQGTTIRYRAYKDAATVPNWADTTTQVGTVYDNALTADATKVLGVYQNRQASNTNAALTLTYDSYTVDRLIGELDVRALIRPFTDTPRLDLGTYWASTVAPQDVTGEWHVNLIPGYITTDIYGVQHAEAQTSKLLDMGVVKNRLAWIRVVITGDDGDGTRTTKFYGSFDGGSSWTLADTQDVAAYNEPIPILAPDQYLQVTNWSPGGVWTHKVEVRADGVLVASPDFAAQPEGTTSFADAQGNVWTLPMEGGMCGGLD